jgi:DNA-binding MarR family transcriptional regulator
MPGPRKLSFDPIDEARRQWEARWDEEAAAEMVAVTSIMRVHQILMARLNELLEPFDLTFPRYEVLMLLLFSRNGSLPLGKIGERLQVHRTSITNSIDGLAKSGFVRRVPHESDGRAVLAEILPPGREAGMKATEVLNGEAFGTDPLAADELGEVFKVLRRLRLGAGDFGD